ncbi:Bug family tripartite tricarboxylate transporter substrate binding protein [Chelatococcus asaccharovorans]|uniref:Bug family tripartite tricarboxylate transporter substrate binding protein n=1 Tax=Chelatococcus asaccharovorans TaxID=28210 RepID=UPI00224C71F9|nr:tripartite tricarboxylate transporter substrate binding protein [Chelatococcus asaccharovorans]CAH1653572.1 Tripartite-type tricarboxylate transporter receptor subunit TctC [Chelatococcus asaccharovorans]CAH1686003.1 Tripartite-type tricarboxylate transporter receptor subunit TctC [Chelatococcus asaccharovorans]
MKRIAGLAMAVTLALLPHGASALDKSQPIRVVTAFPAGGVTDIAGRVIAEGLTKKLGQTVLIDNKPGGDGITGMMEVVKAKPDGNTLLLGGFGGQLIPPLVKKNFPVKIDKALTLLARPIGFTNVLLVNNESSIKSVEDLIAYAKKNPGELNYGSAASTSSDRLTMEMFMQRTGVELTHVPYKGGAAVLNDVSAGVLQVAFGNLPTAMGLLEGNLLRPLAVTSAERVPQFPNVLTMQEAGVEDFDVSSWISIFGPAGMNAADVALLSDAIVKVTMQPEVRAALEKVGFSVIGEGAEEFRSSFNAERERWQAVINKAGLAE